MSIFQEIYRSRYLLLAKSCFLVSPLSNTSGKYSLLFSLAILMPLFSESIAFQRCFILISCNASSASFAHGIYRLLVWL